MPAQTQTGSVQGATWTTAYVDALPSSSFAYVSGDVRKLPYKDADGKVDLPHVRNALARLNQTQGIPDDEKPKIKTKLQNALKSAKADGLDASDFHLNQTHSLQAEGTTSAELPNRLMLLRSGQFDPPKYWPFEITADDLNEMKDNFELGIGLPGDGSKGMPIDFSHKSGEKAAGWVKQLEVEADTEGNATLYGTAVTWSTSGKAAVTGDEYGYLSSDFWPRDWPSEWQSSEQAGLTAHNVIRGVALTNVPMFEGNDGITASDGHDGSGVHADNTEHKGVDFVYVNKQKEKSMNLDELRVKAAADLTGPEALHIAAHASDLSEDERKKFGLEASTQETAEQKTAREAEEKKKQEEIEAAKAAAAAGSTGSVHAAEALKAAQDEIAALKASVDQLSGVQKQSEHDKIQKEVEAHAARGAIKPDQIETFVTAIEASDENIAKGLRASLAAIAANPLLGRKFGSSSTQGSAAEDVEDEVMKKATELVASSQKAGAPIDIFTARKQVLASDPALDLRATQAVQAAAPAFDPYAASWGVNASGLQGVNPEAFK